MRVGRGSRGGAVLLTLLLLSAAGCGGGTRTGENAAPVASPDGGRKEVAASVPDSEAPPFDQWREVAPRGAGFKLRMPGEPGRREEKSGGGMLARLEYAEANGSGIVYSLIYDTTSRKEPPLPFEGQSASDEIEVGGCRAKDVYMGEAPAYSRFRYVYAKDRLVTVALTAKRPEALRDEQAGRFFDSFSFTKSPCGGR